jgi:hypothetical protein
LPSCFVSVEQHSSLDSCFVSDSLHASMSWVVLVLEEPKRNFEIIFLNIQINDSHWYILAFYTNFTPKLAQIFYFLILITTMTRKHSRISKLSRITKILIPKTFDSNST